MPRTREQGWILRKQEWKVAPQTGRKTLSLEFRVQDWYFDIDARDWLAVVLDAVRDHVAKRIKQGLLSTRRSKRKPLGPWIYSDKAQTRLRTDVQRRKSQHRGYATGTLVDGLTRSAVTGSQTNARATIQAPSSRRFFFGDEADRGIEYLNVAGDVTKIAVREAEAYIEHAIEAGQGTFAPPKGPAKAGGSRGRQFRAKGFTRSRLV